MTKKTYAPFRSRKEELLHRVPDIFSLLKDIDYWVSEAPWDTPAVGDTNMGIAEELIKELKQKVKDL